MWGEIEPQIKTQPSLCKNENVDDAKPPEDLATDSLDGHLPLLVHPQELQTYVLVSRATHSLDSDLVLCILC